MNQQGFTLIELLIVIAIIGILAAVLLPNVLNARSSAERSGAQAYARQIASFVAAADLDADAQQAAVLRQITSCTAPQLVAVGAPTQLPAPIDNCQITYDTAGQRYIITATTGTSSFSSVY